MFYTIPWWDILVAIILMVVFGLAAMAMEAKMEKKQPERAVSVTPADVAVLAWKLAPSSVEGKFNIKHPTEDLNLSVDPTGGMSWSPNDKNFEQFTRNGMAMEIAPGDDNNPKAARFVLLPK